MKDKMMKAVRYHKFGRPDVLLIEDVPRPVPQDRQVLVEVFATTVNSGDCHLRSGDPFIARLFAGPITPKNKILGTTFSGRVAQVGKAVTKFQVGDEVYGSFGINSGTHAQFLTIFEDETISLKPDHLSHEEAAALVFGPITALYFLKKSNINSHKRVLIIGAAGGVGAYAVQIAKYFGANVTGVCGTSDTDYVKELGADHIIDYKKQTLIEYCSKNNLKFDIILDMVCNTTISGIKSILHNGGSYTGTLARLPLLIESAKKSQNKRFIFDVSKSTSEDIDFFSQISQQGFLKPLVGDIFDITRIQDAHHRVQARNKRGAVVVTMNNRI